MGRRSRPGGRRFSTGLVALAFVGGILILPALGIAVQNPAQFSIGGLPSNPTPYLPAAATFNGHNVVSANSIAAAVSAQWQNTFVMVYQWNSSRGTGPVVSVSEAVLSIIYFGATIAQRTEVENPPITSVTGSITLNASFASNEYLFGGLYGMTASLVAANGSTAWAQSFYVVIGNPYDLTVVNVVLIAIIIYEVYAIVTCAKGERTRKKPTETAPAPAPAEPVAGPEATTFPSETPPPTGGS